ncbi:MAG: transposase, partial [Mariprofundaceae bacterium]|nr:transposase [Mariprofundaceae bacterium]
RDPNDVILISGDETITTKSGKHSFGLGRFFSSTHGVPVPGLCFLCISLTSVKHRHSFPIIMKQVDKSVMCGCSKYKGSKSADKNERSTKKTGKKGRPKGRKNINRRDIQLSKYLTFMKGCVNDVKEMVGESIPLTYFVFDGELGHNFGVQMT